MAAKVRPCLVLSVQPTDTDRALITLVPHTTAVRGSRFECALSMRFLKPGAFDAQGLVTVPAPKVLHRLGQLTDDQLNQVEASGWPGSGSPAPSNRAFVDVTVGALHNMLGSAARTAAVRHGTMPSPPRFATTARSAALRSRVSGAAGRRSTSQSGRRRRVAPR